VTDAECRATSRSGDHMIRVVPEAEPPEPAEPVTMAEALAAILVRVVAEHPRLVVVIYETGNGEIKMKPCPPSIYVSKVLTAEAYVILHPNSDIAE
jgi:hypothetical protein